MLFFVPDFNVVVVGKRSGVSRATLYQCRERFGSVNIRASVEQNAKRNVDSGTGARECLYVVIFMRLLFGIVIRASQWPRQLLMLARTGVFLHRGRSRSHAAMT